MQLKRRSDTASGIHDDSIISYAISGTRTSSATRQKLSFLHKIQLFIPVLISPNEKWQKHAFALFKQTLFSNTEVPVFCSLPVLSENKIIEIMLIHVFGFQFKFRPEKQF